MEFNSSIEVKRTNQRGKRLYTCAQFSSILKVLCEEHRMKIICFLMQGDRCVQEISWAIKIPQSLTSHHLKVLWDNGIVKRSRDERDSRWIYYSVNREALADLNALYLSFFDENRSGPWQPCCGSSVDCCGVERDANGITRCKIDF
jgi:ArsR family transcriptional regulator